MLDNNKFILEEATIKSIHKAIVEKQINCKELITMCIERINKFDKKGISVNSIITINPHALEMAKKLDEDFEKNGLVGPLHGIPVLLKDNIFTKDMKTTSGSILLKDFHPNRDAFIANKLIEAGAIILAKANLHEFAIGGETNNTLMGQTLNPYDVTRTPGGSSGGTAVGIAMNFGVIGLGTDTVNSVRSPSSACNLVGLRPTYGLLSKSGVIPSSINQDCVGIITRTVEDLNLALNAMYGYDPDVTCTEIANSYNKIESLDNEDFTLDGCRIGILKSFFGNDEIHTDVNKNMYNCIDMMKKAGAVFVDIEENYDAVKLQQSTSVDLFEFKDALNEFLLKEGKELNVKSLSDILESGLYFKGIESSCIRANSINREDNVDYEGRVARRLAMRKELNELTEKYNIDALVYPHQKRPVVKIGESQLERNGILASLLGYPAIVMPAGFTEKTDTAPLGVPVGIEFLSCELKDSVLIKIAREFEKLSKFRRAPVI
ncbi:amidase [Clostridium sp.]|uniref:amidase n=1 Tax=Clostridium sp. TaxID=1506 RepID=UPI002FCA95CC